MTPLYAWLASVAIGGFLVCLTLWALHLRKIEREYEALRRRRREELNRATVRRIR